MRAVLLAVAALLVARSAPGQATCQLVGVWELVSGKADGVAYPATTRQLKLITKNRWAWVAMSSELKELKTTADSLKAFQTGGGGSGTYTISGSTYTEKIELFPDPAYVGLSIPFTCRIDGDRLHQTGMYPVMKEGKKVREVRLEEIYRRIE